MDETAQGRVKSPNYRSASQLYDAGYKEYITDLSYVYLVNPPRMLCAPTQPLFVREEISGGCASRKSNTSLYLSRLPYKSRVSPYLPGYR